MEWTRADVIRLAPEFAAVPLEQLAPIMEEASLTLNRGAFSTAGIPVAGALLTAHLLTLSPPPGVTPTGRFITAETVGGVSVSYVPSAAGGRGDLGQTTYGVRFSRLARARVIGGFVS